MMKNQIAKIPAVHSAIAIVCFMSLAAIVGMASPQSAHAEPQMTVIETPIEGTAILRMRVNKQNKGVVVLECLRCKQGRVRLKVTPSSYVITDSGNIPLGQYTPSSRHFVTGFYLADSNELTRLLVEEMN